MIATLLTFGAGLIAGIAIGIGVVLLMLPNPWKV